MKTQTIHESRTEPASEAHKTDAVASDVYVENVGASTMQSGSTKSSFFSSIKNTLFRHPTEKLVGGVCGGLGDYFGWDPVLVRILWVVATLSTGGSGFLAYLALWTLLPVGTSEGGQTRPAAIELNERNMGRAASVLIVLGAVWLLSNLGIMSFFWGTFWAIVSTVFWPALLIGAGYLLLSNTKKQEWNTRWNDASGRVKTRFENRKMPSGTEFKSGISSGISAARKRVPLARSRSDRMLMGVCGGIAQRIGIDANLVRLVWGAFAIGSAGMVALLYVAIGLFLPEEAPASMRTFEAEDVQVVDTTASRTV